MTTDALILFLLLALLAEILGTVGGFGSSLFFVPIAGYFMDFHSVLAVTALFHLSSNLIKIVVFRQGFNKNLILKVGIPAVLLVFVGAHLTRFLDTAFLEIGLSLFLIVLSLALLIFKNIEFQPNNVNAITGGALSGFLAGLVGTGGAIRGLTLAAFGLDKMTFLATSAIIDLGIDSSRSFAYFLNGFVKPDMLPLILWLMLVSIIGTYVGKKILFYISESQFKNIVLGLVLLTGIINLLHFV
ncbi:sulfite exporter TauE/SafE family protein [Flavobacterium sp. CYK-4]|uniref:sulfite exporter TauE/SafE family protein n=1 Tax=Flavobacterium lotistagni TaxID=2709660 RepID=UPI001408313E|nr:sulfite exporter TauE/SafE family protein [Flavobacterium lotistagni]NHM07544.1 sulfite exporter TauE/SafE family protein [Flavobacterium lotistagni]